jgi:hypothetical protein
MNLAPGGGDSKLSPWWRASKLSPWWRDNELSPWWRDSEREIRADKSGEKSKLKDENHSGTIDFLLLVWDLESIYETKI